MNGSDSNAEESKPDPFIQHGVFWFEEGSITLRVQDHVFKIHASLLSRHSTFFAQNISKHSHDNHLTINPNVSVKDFEVLLEHLYHDAPLFSEMRYTRIASILRVSSPSQLDFPSIHSGAIKRLQAILGLDTADCDTSASLTKFFHYDLVASDIDFGLETSEHTGTSEPTTNSTSGALSVAEIEICTVLMNHLIEYFTPTLFTPPATSHMACTDVFAETWMTRVISPALKDGGVYKPLETLERMKYLEWEKEGVCASCVQDKMEEWGEEQRNVWKAMDEWLGLRKG